MKLYIAHVGFYEEEIGIYEIHSNLFVVAEDIIKAQDLITAKEIYKKKKMHIDGIEKLLIIDGYEINAIKSNSLTKNKTYSHDDLKAFG
jgi:uncharacterized radical SAM superfamily protein